MQVMLCIRLVSPPWHSLLSSITLCPLDLFHLSVYSYHSLTSYYVLAKSLTVCLPSLALCPTLLQCKFLTCRNFSRFIYCSIPTMPGTLQALQKDLLNKARHEYLSAPSGGLCFVFPAPEMGLHQTIPTMLYNCRPNVDIQ